MTYTQAAILGVVVTILLDLFVFRTRLVTRKSFWAAYAIIVFFQLVTNGILTGTRTVQYSAADIIGTSEPVIFGQGRIFFAPVEDLLFGFALILLTLSLWVWWGRRGVQRRPYSGPPVSWFPGVYHPHPRPTPLDDQSAVSSDDAGGAGAESATGDAGGSPGGKSNSEPT